MASGTSALVFLGSVLFCTQGAFTENGPDVVPITVTVENTFSNAEPKVYFTSVVQGGVLLGALRRIQETQQDFKFTVKEHPDFGLYLKSVNGLEGDGLSYWEILAEHTGDLTRLEAGVGCYRPKAFEHIILRFTKSFQNK